MKWLTAMWLGACGGAIFGVFPTWLSLVAAHQTRREALGVGKPLPRFRDTMDVLGDAVLLLCRSALGAIAGLVFHAELTASATVGAVAVGASAPVLLRGLGTIKAISQFVGGDEARTGTGGGPDAAAGE